MARALGVMVARRRLADVPGRTTARLLAAGTGVLWVAVTVAGDPLGSVRIGDYWLNVAIGVACCFGGFLAARRR
ncbi:hypothetical protein ACQPZP_02295 [Spirillospora sp. CA-142024]|uniref:hypothetical protein n=1 Tax=Spirillospora sp. CA-142024 TaxID=3240036 RepID=UPI003D8B132D